MKFREHRGSLEESMATCIDVVDKSELIIHLHKTLEKNWFKFDDEDVHIAPYSYDERTGWHTFIVTIDRFGVVGFTNDSW